MSLIRIIKSGVLYRNPKPHVHSVHAYFPSVVPLKGGEMLASACLGEAFESANLHACVLRSSDFGENWQMEQRIGPEVPGRVTSDCVRLTGLSETDVVAFMIRHDRTDYPDEGLTNPDTLGFVPTELCLVRSSDGGHSWTAPEPIHTPLVGPSFEMCSPITVLRDGRWALATQTWPGWDGRCPSGIRMVALISEDQGQSWPYYWDIMHEPSREHYYWESKVVEFSDGRLMAVAWSYNALEGRDEPNQYALSEDGGKSWSKPRSMGLWGQTLTPFVLEEDRILSVYRRMDKPGLWATISVLDGTEWKNLTELCLWGGQTQGLVSTGDNMSHNFNVLRFGAPCITRCADGSLFVAFWCYEDCIGIIRWFKLSA